MNVLMTADAVGGVWSYALDLARSLERYGVEVTLATMGPRPGAEQLDAARACRNVRLVEGDYRLEWMPEPWQDVQRAGDWLLELESRIRPDVVHVNGYAHAALGWSAPVVSVAHSCVCSWWRGVHGCEAPAEWDRYRAAVHAGIHAANVVVAPSRAMLGEIAALYGAPASARVIANGRDVYALPLGPRDAFGRYPRTSRLPQPLVLAAGRLWDPAKNMDTLAEAARSIRWPVYVAGSASHPAGGRRPLEGLHHLGTLAPLAMHQWQARASIFTHPALYEPFGLAPVEAAQLRTALVLADLPSQREIWGDAAIFVPPRDATAIAAAVNGLIASPRQLSHYAEAAWQASRTMTARRMGADYYSLYRELQQRTTLPPSAEAVACGS
jgi:glycogen synthase